MTSFFASPISGRGRGRKLTVPTLNLKVTSGELPEEGVYAVYAHLSSGPQKAVMHVGPRPTFEDAESAIEVHLLDFKEGEGVSVDLEVEVLGFLREVKQFESPEALKKQIQQDIMNAQPYFRILS